MLWCLFLAVSLIVSDDPMVAAYKNSCYQPVYRAAVRVQSFLFSVLRLERTTVVI